jgi:hypothetical protein
MAGKLQCSIRPKPVLEHVYTCRQPIKIMLQVSSRSYATYVSRFHKGLMISRVERETKRKRANWPGVLLTRKMQKKKNCFSSLY